MRKLLALLTIATLGAAAVACGSDTNDGASAADEDAIEITMLDSRFRPAELTVDKGEDLTLAFTNKGAIPHDAYVGDKDAQKDHEREMRMQDEQGDAGHGEHDKTDEGGITVQPGDTGTLEHRFTKAGTYYIGCHQEGHWDAGMRVKLTVR
jgi:uncharacterized cupredoxin-like copper-binding protein